MAAPWPVPIVLGNVARLAGVGRHPRLGISIITQIGPIFDFIGNIRTKLPQLGGQIGPMTTLLVVLAGGQI